MEAPRPHHGYMTIAVYRRDGRRPHLVLTQDGTSHTSVLVHTTWARGQHDLVDMNRLARHLLTENIHPFFYGARMQLLMILLGQNPDFFHFQRAIPKDVNDIGLRALQM